ncbi:MAG: hypothetical protein IT267_12470 [Saprospiraceae bacterium]|nr:hypothetical protein [Saprospiraceae bacterium]
MEVLNNHLVIYEALHQIYNKLAKNSNGDDATKAHRRLMSHQIAQSLKIVK